MNFFFFFFFLICYVFVFVCCCVVFGIFCAAAVLGICQWFQMAEWQEQEGNFYQDPLAVAYLDGSQNRDRGNFNIGVSLSLLCCFLSTVFCLFGSLFLSFLFFFFLKKSRNLTALLLF